MQALFEISMPIDGKRYLNPQGIDFIAAGPGQQSSSIRLRCGVAIVCGTLSASELAAKLRPWLGDSLLALRSGFLNVAAVDAILPNGSTTICKLRGGSNVGIDLSELSGLDAAMAKAAGTSVKAAA